MIALVNCQTLAINGAYAGASWLTNKHDEALAADIYRRLTQFYINKAADEPIKLTIIGKADYQTPLPGGGTIGFSFFSQKEVRMIAYMKILGYPVKRKRITNKQEIRALKSKITTMPEWPAQKSIAKIGPDSFLVKLNDDNR